MNQPFALGLYKAYIWCTCTQHDMMMRFNFKVYSQLEKWCSQLKQQNVRQTMLVHNKHALHGSTHSNLLELFTHALESSWHSFVLFVQRILCPKSIIRQRIPMFLATEKSDFNTTSFWAFNFTMIQLNNCIVLHQVTVLANLYTLGGNALDSI